MACTIFWSYNAPSEFIGMLATLLRELNGEYLVLFLDDVLVYIKSIEEYKMHLRRLFEILRKHKLYVKRFKCTFGTSEVDFFGYKIISQGVYMQERLFNAIIDWPRPLNAHEVRQLLGLSNFYRIFIRGNAQIVRPISDLLQNKPFSWGLEQSKEFLDTKSALTTAPVLVHQDPHKTFLISTDASKCAVGATLEQDGHPIAFLYHRLSDTVNNQALSRTSSFGKRQSLQQMH